MRSTGAEPSTLDPLLYSPRARWQRRKHLRTCSVMQWMMRAEVLLEFEAETAGELIATMDDLRLMPHHEVAQVRAPPQTARRLRWLSGRCVLARGAALRDWHALQLTLPGARHCD